MVDMQLLVHKRRESLRHGVMEMGRSVAAALRKSIECLRSQDASLAAEIVAEDVPINQLRRMLEQEALLVLAAHQPAGSDLREIGASLDLVSELERIGDYASDVARIVLDFGEPRFPAEAVGQVARLAEDATTMVTDTLTAYRDHDADMARAAATRDDEIDAAERAIVSELLSLMRGDVERAEAGIRLLWATHAYERAADRATNIAERVIYIVSGKIPELD
jgi:phosphate transport system protein